jgi:hypothetical protein
MDSIDCGAGVDRVVVNRSDRVFGCESITRLRGQKVQGDVRLGDETANVLDGWTWRRADLILGFGGRDYLNGHSGADILWGNDESDQLDGDDSPDLLLGGSGGDVLWGNSGNDRLWGGFGLERIYGDWEADDPGDGGRRDLLDRGRRPDRRHRLRPGHRPCCRAPGRRRGRERLRNGSFASRAKPYGRLTQPARLPNTAVFQCVR